LPRRSAPRNDGKDVICHCEQSEAISFFVELLQEAQ